MEDPKGRGSMLPLRIDLRGVLIVLPENEFEKAEDEDAAATAAAFESINSLSNAAASLLASSHASFSVLAAASALEIVGKAAAAAILSSSTIFSISGINFVRNISGAI